MRNHAPRRATRSPQPMSRSRLLLVLAGIGLTGVLLLGGLTFTAYRALQPHAGPAAIATPLLDRRDGIAAAALPSVPAAAATTAGVAADPPAPVVLPVSGRAGAVGVPSGFPHTPLGAVAQLAAIEVRVLEAMSVPLTREVYSSWALPGGAGATGWSQLRNVQAFLAAGRQEGSVKDDGTWLTVLPAGYQVKGVDGPDWVVACVLLDVRATITADARIGYGTCERMQWVDGRWLIGPGTPPAAAPSTWPGSQLALDVGWIPTTSG